MKIEQWASEMFAELKIKSASEESLTVSSSLSEKQNVQAAQCTDDISDMIEPIINTGIFPCKEENFTCKKFSVIKGVPHCQWAFSLSRRRL